MQNLTTTTTNPIDNWENYYKMAEMLSKSDIVPVNYRNNPSNIFIAIQTAKTLNIDIMSVMQNTYILKGKVGIYSSFAISLANKSGYLKESIKYNVNGLGEDMQVTAYAILTDNTRIEFTTTKKQATSEGWGKEGTKYKNLPQLMLMYRAASFLIRTHLPQVLFGHYTAEELQDIPEIKEVTENSPLNKIQKLKDLVKPLVEEVESEPLVEETKSGSLLVLQELINFYSIDESTIEVWLRKLDKSKLEDLNEEQIQKAISFITRDK